MDPAAITTSPGARLHRILAPGLAAAVGVWGVWLIVHLPQVTAAPPVAITAILLAWLTIAALLARRWSIGIGQGAGAGVVTALTGLLLLGSMLFEPGDHAAGRAGESSWIPGAALAAFGLLATGAAIGAIASAIGRLSAAAASAAEAPWHSRLAWVVAVSFLPLLLLGGVVTSTESGLAVTDWPSTFGVNMFLYPKELMQEQPRVFVEHTHRLFGTLVGFCTLVFWVATLLDAGTRRRFGIWATILFLAVCVQGYLGGQRVVQQNAYLGAVHGALGQVLLAFAATLALWMSPGYAGLPRIDSPRTRMVRATTTAALHVSLVQLLLGALYRHLRRGEDPGALHVVLTHAAFSFVVVALAVVGGAALIRYGKTNRDALPPGLSRGLRLLGVGVHASVGLQFMLGWFTFLAVTAGGDRGPVPTADELASAEPVPVAEALLGTAHQANGAILLVLLMLAWAWGRRLHRAAQP